MTSQRLTTHCVIFQPLIWTMEQHARTWEESQTLRSDGESRALIDNIYGWFWCDFLYHLIWNKSISIFWLFMGRVQSFGIFLKGSGLRPSGFTRQATSPRMAGDVIQVWINSSPSNRCISHFKAQLAQLFFIQHVKCTYWIKGILCGYATRSGRHPSGSQRPGPTCGWPCGRWLPSRCLPDRIA